ncbi:MULTISPECIES: DUF4304 domain-containing protein [Agrobacterium]|uniref:DUF4304 domain-containing protein n=1 Tax=Agrobacterium TaxID=357 RepID=UPI0012972A16|nr:MULTISPECIES: DUF4304 domain-containing protein [Agrobacterium]MQB10734.1 DUF4304 domain-containing protein [Agrobacterium sp. ICMP 6402]NTZ90779.1 DUF4304 domain-containing protein [Agrobacterium tumefaciens]
MTKLNPIPDIFKHVIGSSAGKVVNSGFVKRRNSLRKRMDDNVAIIEFQKSRSNTSERLLFTVNLAVVYGELQEGSCSHLEKTTSTDGHLRLRIGRLLPEPHDKWWEITGATDPIALANEVSGLIADKAAPYLEPYLNINELIALWESDRSPGLTSKQCAIYLKKLKEARVVKD